MSPLVLGQSNRIVISVHVELKRRLYGALARRGMTLKSWFEEQARLYLARHGEQMMLPLDARDSG